MDTIVFFNIGWMDEYRGQEHGEKIVGGGSWIDANGTGFEVANYSREHSRQIGFVRSPTNTIRIERLGASLEDEAIDGVTVVWTATRPGFGSVVIGWYRNATVYRNEQTVPGKVYKMHRANGITRFNVEAAVKDITLLPVEARTLSVPTANSPGGGRGQSNVWYAQGKSFSTFLGRVRKLIANGGPAPRGGNKAPRSPDADHNARVEQAAAKAVTQYYEKLGYVVISVEKLNRGWDLEATSGDVSLQIEVKGLSGKSRCVEVTPNEYRALKAAGPGYRLAVVSDALSKSPALALVAWNPSKKLWKVLGEASALVNVEPITAARITIS